MEGNIGNTQAGEIIAIPIGEIWQHPDNPRKDLGDLSELSESIKKNGIMQNLTVIPGHWEGDGAWKEDGYTLVIGHRRCAAAKMAGIGELPCRVVGDMAYKDQVATMLEENMQRNDLTIWEQANGFQMMLDLGDTEEQVAEKTGFSKATIRRRLNIAKLDQDELRKKEQDDGFQLTLKDLYELEKIKDVETRNKVLKDASDSRQLVWKAKEAARAEKRSEAKKKFEALFEAAGIPRAPKGSESERYDNKWHICQKWELDGDNPPESLKDYGKDAVWTIFWGETIAVMTPAREKERQQTECDLKQQQQKKAREGLKERHKAFCERMRRCVLDITTGEIAPLKESVEFYRELVGLLVKSKVAFYESILPYTYAGKGLHDLEKKDPEEYEKYLEWKKGLTLEQEVIAHLYDAGNREMFGYYAEYDRDKAEDVMAVVGFLAKYGFDVSEEEQWMLDGTHELYQKGKGDAEG